MAYDNSKFVMIVTLKQESADNLFWTSKVSRKRPSTLNIGWCINMNTHFYNFLETVCLASVTVFRKGCKLKEIRMKKKQVLHNWSTSKFFC